MSPGPADEDGSAAAAASRADLEAELARVRERERGYRELLEEAQRHAEASRRLTDTLVRLSVAPDAGRGGDRPLEGIVRAAQAALGVARVGVWLTRPDGNAIACTILAEPGAVRPDPGLEIARADCPEYFAAVLSGRGLAIEDVGSHPAARELTPYTDLHGIGAMLDVPIRIAGEVAGILCHEHAGGARRWTAGEIAFAASIGDLAALSIEHERTERARRGAAESMARYRYLVESLPVVVYAFDAHGAIDYVSPNVAALTGEPPPRWLGPEGAARWLARVHAEDREAIRARLSRGPSDAGKVVEYRILDAEGAERWVRDHYTVVRAADGAPLGVQGILEDVTVRVLSDRQRAEWERRFHAVLASADVLAVMLDAQGVVTYANEAFLRALGRTEAEALGRDWRVMVGLSPPEEGQGAGAPAAVDEPPMESHVRSAAGGARVIRWTTTVLRSAAGGFSGTARIGIDLTDRAELEARERQAAAEETLGRLAAGVAHDLTNALAGLELSVGVLRGPPGRDAQFQREALECIEACAARATELTRGLLDVARDRPVDPQRLDVRDVLASAEPLLRAITADRPAVLGVRRPSDPTHVVADATQLQRVLMNLVANARDATPDGGRIEVRAERVFLGGDRATALHLPPGPYCAIEVEDAGLGIPRDALERVFEPYFTTKGQGAGLGLGLAASRTMVRGAGGEIVVSSAPGRGTCVVVYLPAVDAPQRA